MSNDKKHKALGRGLSTLLPSRPAGGPPPGAASGTPNPGAASGTPAGQEMPSPGGYAPTEVIQITGAVEVYLDLDEIIPNPLQPRKTFQAEKLAELAASIREHGIIQPLIVRKHPDGYQIVAGERRWRGAKLAGLKTVPALVHNVPDERLLEVALIENIQREDLNPIEMAEAYERLGRLGLSQEEIGKRTGMDRASVANQMRLLKLPIEVQLLLAEERLSTGQARALLRLSTEEDQIKLAEKAAEQGLSVRQVEALVQAQMQDGDLPPKGKKRGPQRDQSQDPNVRAAVEILERTLGTRVKIVELSAKRGRIEIEYYSAEDLDRLFQQVVGEKK